MPGAGADAGALALVWRVLTRSSHVCMQAAASDATTLEPLQVALFQLRGVMADSVALHDTLCACEASLASAASTMHEMIRQFVAAPTPATASELALLPDVVEVRLSVAHAALPSPRPAPQQQRQPFRPCTHGHAVVPQRPPPAATNTRLPLPRGHPTAVFRGGNSAGPR